jgi:rod shape determining protein RodA
MRTLLAWFQGGDRWIMLAYAGLTVFSLLMLWSVTEGIRGAYATIDPGISKSIFVRQVVWVLLGWLVMGLGARLPLRHLENLALPLYLLSILLLAATLLLAPSIGGARRWLVLGPLRVQPSELAKVGFLLATASLMSRPGAVGRQLPALLSILMTAVPFLLVLWEPDLGTSLVFLALWLGMIFWYGISPLFLLAVGTAVLSAIIGFYSEQVAQNPWPWGLYLLLVIGVLYLGRFSFPSSGVLLILNLVTGIGVRTVWERLKPYQQERILTFFEPGRDAFGSGYQAIQSKVAIGSGGLFGTHYLQGTQKGLAFLPERHTDFIFSVVGEELGFAGAVLLLILFLVIVLRGLDIAAEARRPFPAYLAIGIATYFAFHVVVNVAITTGLLPVTGLPLPLISYGGSNLIVSAFMLGLLSNAATHRYDT